jgi:preprotein translocase subunit SecD
VRRHLTPLIFFVVISLGSLIVTLAVGNKPQYGLDLQGGISVVLRPNTDVPNDVLDRAVQIIRQRVDSLGVAEPEIGRQGNNVLVQLPGVEDQQRALDLIGATAELRFRPVLKADIPASDATLESLGVTTTTTVPGASTTTTTTTTLANASTTTVAGDGSTTTTAPTTTLSPEEERKQLEEALGLNLETTPRDQNTADATVVLPEIDPKTKKEIRRFELGPATLKGDAVEDARREQLPLEQGGGFSVNLVIKGGETGIDAFNNTAALCVSRAPQCPTGLLAIELDGRVLSAPQVQTASFERDKIQVTGNFTKGEANDLAIALRYGALPITLELQTTQTVSATLGSDALHAGVAAGLIGVFLVSVLMIAYYRWFGVLSVVALLLSTALLWSIIAYLGETQGLALTLAGVTGLVVSIGVQLDSSIMYFEHMKEQVWNGRTPRSAVDRAFKGAWGTIKKADFAALIGAMVLYFLAVGAVRGFALYLALATVIDLFATYLFVAPAARVIARLSSVNEHPTRFGLPKPIADVR